MMLYFFLKNSQCKITLEAYIGQLLLLYDIFHIPYNSSISLILLPLWEAPLRNCVCNSRAAKRNGKTTIEGK
jgi:hypothetical protein